MMVDSEQKRNVSEASLWPHSLLPSLYWETSWKDTDVYNFGYFFLETVSDVG